MIVQRAALNRCTAAFGRNATLACVELQSLLVDPKATVRADRMNA